MLIAIITACGGSEYKELKNFLIESNTATESFIKKIDKADTAKKAAEAIESFNMAMSGIQQELSLHISGNPEVIQLIRPISDMNRKFLQEGIMLALNLKFSMA